MMQRLKIKPVIFLELKRKPSIFCGIYKSSDALEVFKRFDTCFESQQIVTV